LKAERSEIEKLKRDIEIMRDDLTNIFTNVHVSEQKNLKTLAATYTNLSPTAALAIFQEMDDEMVVKILAFMKPDPVSQILEEMARTRDGDGTLAGRAANLSNRLRLLRQAAADENT
jgi:flagellar motility protein MotE (MotC chaperone)